VAAAVSAKERMCVTEKELKSRVATAQLSTQKQDKLVTGQSQSQAQSRMSGAGSTHSLVLQDEKPARSHSHPSNLRGVLQRQTPAHCHSPESKRRMQEQASSAHSYSVSRNHFPATTLSGAHHAEYSSGLTNNLRSCRCIFITVR
jgi:hypothetical protein